MKTILLSHHSFHFGVSWLQTILIFALGIIVVQIIRRLTRKKNSAEQAQLDAWHQDPKNWKAGVFYFNPLDHRIFPPKRVAELGWTVNFANPTSVLTLVVVTIIILMQSGLQI